MNYCLLRLVDADCNNNKEYEMTQISNTLFESSWGRIKGTKMKKTYSMSMWDKIRQEKLNKGYTDVTRLVSVIKEQERYACIPDETVRKLVDELLRAANTHVRNTYNVDKKNVTSLMVSEAQKHIDNMNEFANQKDCFMFNKEFQQLLLVIPQKIKNVADVMAKNQNDMPRICIQQQATLDVLKSLIGNGETRSKQKEKTNENLTILDAFGIEIRPCTDKEISKIKEKLTKESDSLLEAAFRIEQKDLESRYRNYKSNHDIKRTDEHFFWHGTRTENVWSIMKNGMVLNPKAVITGKMFGYGLYFAPRAKKSINYTSLEGAIYTGGTEKRAYMFVMKVVYKKPYDVYRHNNAFYTYRNEDIKAHNCDALYAHKGVSLVNDEIIVYDEAQVCPRYLLVLTKDTKKTA